LALKALTSGSNIAAVAGNARDFGALHPDVGQHAVTQGRKLAYSLLDAAAFGERVGNAPPKCATD
jgi:hypothetical protein